MDARVIADLPAPRRAQTPARPAPAAAGSVVADAVGFTSATSAPSSIPSMAVRLSDWATTFTTRGSKRSPTGR